MPVDCTESWRRKHPSWAYRIWTNRDLENVAWVNAEHMRTFVKARKWAAVADLMRYEILYREGGVYVDADARCLRPLDDWLLENEMFACWDYTLAKRKLVNNAFMGSVPRNPFLAYVIEEARRKSDVLRRWSWSRMRFVKMGAWRSVGPYHLTDCINRYQARDTPTSAYCRRTCSRRTISAGVLTRAMAWFMPTIAGRRRATFTRSSMRRRPLRSRQSPKWRDASAIA